MRKHTKGFLSAIISAALCTAGIPLNVVNADIIIDHDCSGIDKGYYFEMANNDKDSQPEFKIKPSGNYSCSWDNDEDFSASRALKFASPVEYSKLGAVSFKYWKRIDMESFKDDKNGYVRFGIRLHNSKGDVFDILEIDSSPDEKGITEKQSGYREIGKLDSKEILHDYSIFGPTDGESIDVAYSLYVRENEDGKGNTFLCRRDEPMSVNNDIEDERRININDKLDAIASAGYDLGEITDIGLFLESSYSKGEAIIYTYEISIENMPEIAPDEYEDEEAPIILMDNDFGVRTGYYYGLLSRFPDDKMEVMAPSLFKAEWDSRENKYNTEEYFERGKQYEKGQSYKAVSDSSIEYTMNFDVEGSFAVSAAAKLSTIELPQYFLSTEFYIVDACSEGWTPSERAVSLGKFSAEGVEYEVYDGSVSMIGTGKAYATNKYYFISKDAETNGKKGTVTAKHDMAPYMEYVYGLGYPLSAPDVLVAQMNGDVSKGTAELVKNEVTLPEFIPDDGEFDREKRKIDLNILNREIYINGLTYGEKGEAMTMKGYAGEKIDLEWDKYRSPAFSSSDYEYPRNFYIGQTSIQDEHGKYGIKKNETMIIDYDVSMGDITALTNNPYWAVGGRITCFNQENYSFGGKSEDYSGCEIFVADKWDGELTGKKDAYRDPEDVGTIESNGVKYDVILTLPEVQKDNSFFVLLKRQEQLEAAFGTERYAGTIDVADIVEKLIGLGIKTYNINDVCFSLEIYGNEGSAVVNSANVKKADRAAYTADDLEKLSSFLLGEKTDIPTGTDYDLNGDGVWDIYDLCLMRKELAKNIAPKYVEPDTRWNFGMAYDVVGAGVKLYLGPDKSYEVVASIPVGTQLTELGYQFSDNIWFFTEYNGQYGWISTEDAVTSVSSGWAWGKPVIYLYPEEETDVHVELELTTSDLTTTYPKYNNGWDVTAYPDGSLLNKADGTHHRYLFWESDNARTRFDYSKGFCVAGSDTESFLKEKLTYMGLTEQEMNEFIVYWLPYMEHNAYNLITFQGDLYTDAAKLDITPAPDSMLRIFMAYVPLEKAVDVEPQQLETFERKGFTVVEWGGAKIQD